MTKSLCKVSFSKDPSCLEIGTVKNFNVHRGQEDSFKIARANFSPNNDFTHLLHDVFNEKVYDDITYQLDALNFISSYLPLGDFKVILKFMNQRPDVENTIGYVHVDESGAMIKGSYQSNDIYELCNCDGVIALSDYMLEQIRKAI